MKRMTIKVNTIDALNWPERCPHCGQDLKERDNIIFELKIRKGLKAMLKAGFGSKNLPVRLCGACAKKISNFRTIEAIGGTIMFVAIAPLIFQRFIKIESIEYKYIMGAALWVGVVLMAIAEVGMRKGMGMECRSLALNSWSLKFWNDLFYNEFVSLNTRNVERG